MDFDSTKTTLSRKEEAETFIRKNTGLLKSVANRINKSNWTMADFDDIYTECIIATYDVFKKGIGETLNRNAYVARAVEFRAKESLWDFHRGATMSYNTMKSHYRKTGEKPVAVMPFEGGLMSNYGKAPSPEKILDRNEDMKAVKSLLSEVSDEKETLLIEYIYKQGMSLKDAGDQMGVSKSTVYFAEKRMLDKMRSQFDLKINLNGRYA